MSSPFYSIYGVSIRKNISLITLIILYCYININLRTIFEFMRVIYKYYFFMKWLPIFIQIRDKFHQTTLIIKLFFLFRKFIINKEFCARCEKSKFSDTIYYSIDIKNPFIWIKFKNFLIRIKNYFCTG